MIQTIARNASLEELHQLLSVQHEAKHDAIVPARKLHYNGGYLVAAGMGMDGPAGSAGIFRPTEIFDAHIASALEIPLPYVRRMRKERVDMLDANVNGWLHRDDRKFFLRTFLDTDERDTLSPVGGIARGLLSDRYRRVDNLDTITAVLAGIRELGVDARVSSCHLTDRRMQVRIVAPDIAVHAGALLTGYRDPFGEGALREQRRRQWSERTGIDIDAFGDSPVVFAGFVVTNSEVGEGAACIWPQITVLSCLNGQTFAKDVLRNVHLGARLDEGVVDWSPVTQQKNLELIQAMTTDAVKTFLDSAYAERKITEITEKASVTITNPNETVTLVGQQLRFTEETIAGIFNHFIRGGQVTAGGVMQAVTSYAQEIEDPDAAWELELQALNALDAAVVLALS